MSVIASRNHKKGHIVYHKSGCIYEKRVHPDNRWSLNMDYVVTSNKFCACKYCDNLQGELRVHKTQIKNWKKRDKVQISYDEETNTVYVRTRIGFWKIYNNESLGKYFLYHRNTYDESLDEITLMQGKFHRQVDVKPMESFQKLITYIIAHDKAKIIMMDDYRKLPRNTKKQRKYYKQAKNRERRKAIKNMDLLFAKIEEENPELKAMF